MGTETPPPPVVGETCAIADGILWPVGKTPKFIHARLAELVECPIAEKPPPNGIWVIQQHPDFHCQWFLETDLIRFEINVHAVGAIQFVWKGIPLVPLAFMAYFSLFESDYANEIVNCDAGDWSHGGNLHIDWW